MSADSKTTPSPTQGLVVIAMLATAFFGGYALRSWQEPSWPFDAFLFAEISECSGAYFLIEGYSRKGWQGHCGDQHVKP